MEQEREYVTLDDLDKRALAQRDLALFCSCTAARS